MVRRWKPLQDSTYRGSVTRVQPGFEASRTGLGAMARMMAASTPRTSTSATATDENSVKPVTVYVPIKLTDTMGATGVPLLHGWPMGTKNCYFRGDLRRFWPS
jgi:hypothetical protein